MKKEYRIYGYLTGIIISLVLMYFKYRLDVFSESWKEILTNIMYPVLLASIVGVAEYACNEGWKFLKPSILKKHAKVYVSLSYLIQIQLEGCQSYLLVKGSKVDQYQPVGGVYRLLGSKNIKDDWQAELKEGKRDDAKDLRFFVKAKYLYDIYKWFTSGKNREYGVWREFQEELIETKILCERTFRHVDVEYLRMEEKFMRKETRFKDEKYHTILYDVFRLILTTEQEQALIKLKEKAVYTDQYAFVTSEEIEKECFQEGFKRIGAHSVHVLNYKRKK
ncbi:hypothetical protein [Myroides marinus]|uniref:SMODS-associated NUDIX domain-containing protein n=1 Tax=Myroides marinus TaxID=703342 RepID=UPI0025752B69|nr:hypothetical protein [Myroides marinus]MDM1361857.1 hypothetical protein [Myroides marinus]MDM1373143.1 hypothetical protein [Myroides marinus]